jgi:hypothetical protein
VNEYYQQRSLPHLFLNETYTIRTIVRIKFMCLNIYIYTFERIRCEIVEK